MVEHGEQVKIRGYVLVYADETYFFSSTPITNNSVGKSFTFELNVPNPLPELKVDVTTIKEIEKPE